MQEEIDRLTVAHASIARDMGRLLESANLAARRVPAARPPYRVVFLVHNIDAWDSSADVFEAMRADPDFEPIAVTIPRRFGGRGAYADEDLNSCGLDRLGTPHLRFDFADPYRGLHHLKQLTPDLIFRQSQWDIDVQAGYSAMELAFTRLAYIPYELFNHIENVPPPDGGDSAVDEPLHRWASFVFCANEYVLRQAERGGVLGGTGWTVTGHPKAERIRRTQPVWPLPAGPRRPRVLYAAHHSLTDDWTRFGMFPRVAPGLLAWARDRPDIEFAFSYHPSLPAVVEENPEFQPVYDEFLRGWTALPNTGTVAAGSGYLAAFAATDVLLTDGLSAQLEGQVLGKPLVWLERAGHREFNAPGRIVLRGLHAVPDLPTARRETERLLEQPDELAAAQREVVAELFGADDPVPRILGLLRAGLAGASAISG